MTPGSTHGGPLFVGLRKDPCLRHVLLRFLRRFLPRHFFLRQDANPGHTAAASLLVCSLLACSLFACSRSPNSAERAPKAPTIPRKLTGIHGKPQCTAQPDWARPLRSSEAGQRGFGWESHRPTGIQSTHGWRESHSEPKPPAPIHRFLRTLTSALWPYFLLPYLMISGALPSSKLWACESP